MTLPCKRFGTWPMGFERRPLRSLPARELHVIAAWCSAIELARTANLLVRFLDHFLPLGDPADRARECEQHGKHRGRDAHRLERDAGIEIDIRVELLLDEIVIVQRDALELHCDITLKAM